MESNLNFAMVGGVTRVVLFPTKTPIPEAVADPDDSGYGYVVDLSAGGASYSESHNRVGRQYRVRHTLKFRCEHADSPFTPSQLVEATRQGVVADVTLATGASFRVGWSERYRVEFPLRLVSSEFVSGNEAVDYPMREWVWESYDMSDLLLKESVPNDCV